jgi:non-ribosomal peptide synthetase component F
MTFAGRLEAMVIDGELGAALRRFGRERGATLFMTMFTAFATLLHRYSGQEDIVIGVGMANRQRPETENLLGMMINTCLMRVRMHDDPAFEALLERVKDKCLGMYAHQDMPFEKLVDHLHVERSLGRMPLCQVLFTFLDTPMPALEMPGLSFEVLDAHNQTAKFDLNIVLQVPAEQRTGTGTTGAGGEIILHTEYNADVFDAETVRTMLGHFRTIMTDALADPGRTAGSFLPGLQLPRVVPALESGPSEGEAAVTLDLPDAVSETAYVAPRTPVEARLAAIWSDCLQVDQVGVDDEFFDLGGHSLLATQVMSRVQQEFQLEIPLRRLFEAPTVAELAVVLVEAQAALVDDSELASLVAELEN